jgi:hypothetical protein
MVDRDIGVHFPSSPAIFLFPTASHLVLYPVGKRDAFPRVKAVGVWSLTYIYVCMSLQQNTGKAIIITTIGEGKEQVAGENYIMRSFIICTLHQILG